MTVIKIDDFEGEIVNVRGKRTGRAVSTETQALRDAIQASATTGKPKRWAGAATAYKPNSTKLRNVAGKMDPPYRVSIGLSGTDLTFKAELKNPAPEEVAETATAEAPGAEKAPEAVFVESTTPTITTTTTTTPTPTPPKKRAAAKK